MNGSIGVTPVIAFVGVSGQGWRTYIDAIAPLCRQHPDFDAVFIDLPKEVGWIGAQGVEKLRRHGSVLRAVRRIDARGYLRARHIRRRLRDVQPNHVHFFDHHLANALMFGRWRSSSPPFSVTTTGTAAARLLELEQHPIRHRFGEVHSFLQRRARRELATLETAEFIACISSYAIATLPESVRDKAFLSPFCVTPIEQDESSVADTQTHTITFIGADMERKGGQRVVQWVRDGRLAPHPVEIVTFDPPPPDAADVPGLVWLGRTDNQIVRCEVLPRTSVLVLPTWLDSSPVVLLEAAAAGVPAVASNVRGIPDLVIDGVTGFVIDTDDDDAFIDAVHRLSDDPMLRATMSIKAREHYRQNFTPERAVAPLLDRLSLLWQG